MNNVTRRWLTAWRVFGAENKSKERKAQQKKTKNLKKKLFPKSILREFAAQRGVANPVCCRKEESRNSTNAMQIKSSRFFFVVLTLPGGSCPIGTMWTNSSLSLFFPKYNDQKRSLILIRENRRKIIYRGASVDYSSIGDDFPAALVGLEDPREKKKRKINSSGNNFFFPSSTWSPVGLP